jgi:hypothetical protein
MGRTTKNIRKNKRKEAEKELAKKVNMFDRLPDKCMTCEKDFDKTDKEMVNSWYVIVREEEKRVNLYCPPCWTQALEIINDFRERVSDRETT